MAIKKSKNDPELKKWETEFSQVKQEILEVEPFRKGSIIERWQICGNSNCRCRKNEKYRHGPYYSWTLKEAGKTKTIIVPLELLDEAKNFLKNEKLFNKKIKSLIQLSENIFRRKVELIRNKRFKKKIKPIKNT